MGKLSNFFNKFSRKESDSNPNSEPPNVPTLDQSSTVETSAESMSPNSVSTQTSEAISPSLETPVQPQASSQSTPLSSTPPLVQASSPLPVSSIQTAPTIQPNATANVPPPSQPISPISITQQPAPPISITPIQSNPQTSPTPSPSTSAPTMQIPSPLMTPTASGLPTINQPQLFQITTQMLRIPLLSSLGTNLQNFIYDASLTQEKIMPYTNQFQELIAAEQAKLAKLRDPSDVLTEYITHATFLARQTTSTESPTYETFLNSTAVDLIKKEAVVLTTLKQLIPHLFDASTDFDFNEFLRKYAIVISQINDVAPKLESFTASADALRNDILAFTATINQYQNNKMLAVDWNSKKGALANTRATLDQRRNAFLTDETTINNALAQVASQFQPLHNLFANVIPQVIPHLETMRQNIVPDQQLANQRAQINQTLKDVIPLYEELKTYTLGLQN